MANIDSLPPDQRAVLQLVLQRGRSYDQIADMLSIDRAAVRQRALDALDTLAPADAGSAPAERSLITDYLLGQLPSAVSDQVQRLLRTSDADNAWARAISRELDAFADNLTPVPELGATPSSGPAALTVDPSPAAPATAAREPDPYVPADPWLEDDADSATPDRHAPGRSYERPRRERPAGSRRGGALLLSGIGAVIVVIIVLAITGVFSGGSGPAPTTHHASETTTKASDGSTTNSAQYLAQINLHAPNGATTPAGIVQVVEETLKGKRYKGIVVYASGVPANTKQNAYAIWLSNPGGSSRFIGFDPKLVGSSGKLQTEGELPADATDYKQILITLETSEKPTKPGTVVLSGDFTETGPQK